MPHHLVKSVLIPEIVRLIAEKEHISEDAALGRFYLSDTAKAMDDDKTGLYGDSADYIFSLYEEEKRNTETMIYHAREKQPLAKHINEVARLAGLFGQTFGAETTAAVAGLLHDFGKYTPAFQDYLNDRIKGIARKRGEVIHAYQGAKYILQHIDKPVVAEIIANVIAAHHTGLLDGLANGVKPLAIKTQDRPALYYAEAEKAYFTENTLPEEYQAKVKDEVLNIYRLSKASNFNPCFMLHLWTKAVYSCLVDADRCNAAGLSGEIIVPDWNEYSDRLEKHLAGYNNVTKIEQARQRFSEQCGQAGQRKQGIYTLSLPTGGGKTLSSLRFALQHAQKYNLKRIIYVIPYLSILDQTAKTFYDVLNVKENGGVILEHHSNINIPETNEEEEQYKLLTARWDSPIILTTMVQFLETVYSNRASQLRKFHNIGEAVIIFDEIQSLPVKCVYLFNEAINFLHTFGKSTVLLCTATQPQLHKLVECPVKLADNADIVELTEEEKKCFKRVDVQPVMIANDNGIKTFKKLTTEKLAAFTKQQLDAGKSTLVILNTKGDAGKLYDQCRDFDCEKQLLTTNFCPAHRLEKLEQLRQHLKEKRKMLCISTQLIEAGVDISFDRVIRAAAGLDSIVQAAGRCNRNGDNPIPQTVYVVKLKDENLDRLPEIKEGQDQTELVCREMQNESMLSETALNHFYDYYFHTQKEKMLYQIANPRTSLYDLLSVHSLGIQGYEGQQHMKYTPLVSGLPCAFAKAAEKFSVIDKNQTGIVVPYNEDAKALVNDFQKEYNPKEKYRILQKLQKYTVSVYQHVLQKLREFGNAVSVVKDTESEEAFYYLDAAYYNDETGLLDEKQNPFLME